MGERLGSVGEVLRHLRRSVEADDKRQVEPRPDDLVQELDGCFLLELEAIAHRIAGVDEQSHAQRQVSLPAKRADALRRLAVVKNSEIVLRKVFYEVADRKSTRLNSSHLGISYAVFC